MPESWGYKMSLISASVVEYVKKNPFPSFEEMYKKIYNDLERSHWLEWFADYGDKMHNMVVKCYDNVGDNKILKETSKELYEKEGFHAWINCFQILLHCSNINDCTEISIRERYYQMLRQYYL